MDNEDKISSENISLPAIEENENQLSLKSRRRFTRNALAGGAVLLTLGNRSAWGGGPAVGACVSQNTYVSIAAGYVASQTTVHSDEIAEFKDYFDANGPRNLVDLSDGSVCVPE